MSIAFKYAVFGQELLEEHVTFNYQFTTIEMSYFTKRVIIESEAVTLKLILAGI